MNKLSSGITELSLDDINNVSGGHSVSIRELHTRKGHTEPVPGQAAVLDEPGKLPHPASHGGWGKGGING